MRIRLEGPTYVDSVALLSNLNMPCLKLETLTKKTCDGGYVDKLKK